MDFDLTRNVCNYWLWNVTKCRIYYAGELCVYLQLHLSKHRLKYTREALRPLQGYLKTLLYFGLRSSNQKWRLQILLVRVVEEMKRGFYEFANSTRIQSIFMYQFILTVECLQWKIVNAALFTSCTLRIHFCSRPAIFLRHRKISIRTKFDWFRKLSPTSQPIRRKTQDNRDLFIRVSNALSIFLVSALSSHWLIFMKNLALIGLWNNWLVEREQQDF